MTKTQLYRNAKRIRLIGKIVQSWWLLAGVLYFTAANVPHMRWADPWKSRQYAPCAYLGPRGFIENRDHYRCPFLIILNANQQRKI